MKYIAFIVLGLVLLATIGGIVLRANMPTARLTIHAVPTTETNFNKQLGPIWDVAVTNTGSAAANWYTILAFKDAKGVISHGSRLVMDLQKCFLLPKQGVVTHREAPSDSNVVWAIEAQYTGQMGSLEKRLSSCCKPVPMLCHLFPNEGTRIARDVWRMGTNAATAH